MGRFTQEDIYRGDGLNLYAYCGNNAVVYYDWSGFAKSKCEPKASAFGEMSKEDAKKYNEYWDNVAASQGKIKDYNKAIKKVDVLGDYYEVKLKYETDVSWGKKIKDMNIDDFNYKSKILQELSDKNQLYKTPSNRNAYITKSYKKYIREDLIKRYKDNPTKLKEELKKLKSMDSDHLWELQLGGLDEFENLEMIDGFTNRRIGQNLGVQMIDVSEGARIKIIIER